MLAVKYVLTWIAAFFLIVALPAGASAQQPVPSAGDEAQQIAILKSDAPLFEKAKACQMLAVIGTNECVPVLAGLLPNPELSHYARFGLEPNSDPAVDEALRGALDTLKGGLLVGVINTIGMRRDMASADALKKLTSSTDQQVAAAAMAALGRLATPEAIELLTAAIAGEPAMRPAAADACLTAVDMLLDAGQQDEAIRLLETLLQANLSPRYAIAALHGAIRARGADGLPMLADLLGAEDPAKFAVALRMSHELRGGQVAQVLIDSLKDLPTQRRALVIYVLGNLGEPAALPVVMELAKSEAADVRLPAVEVLASLGDASAVPVLLDAAAASDEALAAAARKSLADLRSQDVNAKLGEMLGGSSGAQQLVLIELAGLRGIDTAVPTLTKLADADDQAVRTAAIRALGLTIGLAQLPALIDRLVAPKSPDAAAAAKEALNTAVLRMPDRNAAAEELIQRLPEAPLAAKSDLLGLLGVIGGDRALQGVAAAARDSSDEVQDAATRVLGEWMTADAAPVLLELAKTGADKYKVRTLRGYIRIARQLDVPLDERVEMCRKTIEAAQRDDERRLALEVLGRYPTPAGLQLAAAHLDNAALKEAAAEAAVAIAEKIVDADPAAVAAAMEKAAVATSDQELAQKAKTLQRRAQRKPAAKPKP
jgi:HEAT repeat protein